MTGGVSAPGRIPGDAAEGEDLGRFCGRILAGCIPALGPGRVRARFYPYIGLTHTIRRSRRGDWEIRISDHCRLAPPAVLEAVVTILAAKIVRRKPSRRALEAYEGFRTQASVVESVRLRRLERGKKRFAPHAGSHHPLPDVYAEVNRRYFNSQVQVARIGWGLRRSRTRLGHYDPVHHTVTLSPVLDCPEVPRFVLEFIVYHEMLHAVFEGGGSAGHHPPEFRRAERAHPDYGSARGFLREFCRRRK